MLIVLAAKLPQPPIDLANMHQVTTAYQIGLTWSDGVYNGASPVLDYQISLK